MRELTDFKNIHKNDDIYILASGKSVDFIDNSFFEKKIIIGINQAYKKINCTYLVRKEYKLLNIVIKACPDTIHFISKGNCGDNNKTNLQFILNNYKNNNNIIVYKHNINISNLPHELINDKLVVSRSTITTGIHLAAYMGAKNIILIGHDCGCINNEPNFKGYHSEKTYKIAHRHGKKDYKKWLSMIENQTLRLKKLLKKKYNCNIYSLNPFINFGLEGNKYTK